MPPSFRQLSNLAVLDISGNNIQLTPSIGGWERLKEFYYQYPQIPETVIPSEIGRLSLLEVLSLTSQVLLTSLPTEIGLLESLTTFKLNENSRLFVPSEIGKLVRLKNLDLRNCKSSHLTQIIGNHLTNLEFLLISETGIDSIDFVEALTRLTRLDAESNKVTRIPTQIGRLSDLLELRLIENSFTQLPSEIGLLSKLTILTVGKNPTGSIPSEIGLLTQLTELDISAMNLSSLPSYLSVLSKITILKSQETSFRLYFSVYPEYTSVYSEAN